MVMLTEIKKALKDTSIKERVAIDANNAKEVQWNHWYEDVPVTGQELVDLLQGVSKAMPSVKFFPAGYKHMQHKLLDENGVYQTSRSVRVASDFHVYLDEFPFALGRVGFGDFSVGGEGDRKYMVFSRKIANAKFAVGREQHNMIMTGDVKKSVRNACKYLVPYSTKEIARAYFGDMQRNVKQAGDNASGAVSRVCDPLRGHSVLLEEIQNLMKLDVAFATSQFKDVAKRLPEVLEEYNRQMSRKISTVFVRLHKVGDQVLADVNTVDNALQGFATSGDVVTYTMDELPEDLKGSIAVLNILEDGQYVPEVGRRVDEEHFWLERG